MENPLFLETSPCFFFFWEHHFFCTRLRDAGIIMSLNFASNLVSFFDEHKFYYKGTINVKAHHEDVLKWMEHFPGALFNDQGLNLKLFRRKLCLVGEIWIKFIKDMLLGTEFYTSIEFFPTTKYVIFNLAWKHRHTGFKTNRISWKDGLKQLCGTTLQPSNYPYLKNDRFESSKKALVSSKPD